MTEERALYIVRDPVHVLTDDRLKDLHDVRCPHCGRLLAQVTAGSTVKVKCLKCRTWIVQTAA